MDFTLLICTLNRAPLLRRCLGALTDLVASDKVKWEVLVVDNGSRDETKSVVEAFAEEHPGLVIRLLCESRPGVAHARKTGIAAARGEWVAFVDDDCFLREDWLMKAVEFARANPKAGAFGGKNLLEWESEPSELCLAYGESLARQDLGSAPVRLPCEGRQGLCGAGMVLRRRAVVESGYLSAGMLCGRHPARLGAGEDTEIQFLVRNAGWEIWYAPELVLRHWIPAERMTMRHLLPLHRGFGEAEIYLRLLGHRQPLTRRNRWRGLGWALRDLSAVMKRFWRGFVCYERERPTWVIRLWHAIGCVKGAMRLLVVGRAL